MHSKKIQAFLTAAAFCLSAAAFPAPVAHAEDSLADLQAQYNQLERQIAENQKKIDQNESDKTDQKNVVAAFDTEIRDLNSQITILNKKLSLLNEEIENLNDSIDTLDREVVLLDAQITQAKTEIALSQTRIDNTYQKVLDRLTKSYMAGGASELEVLFGAKDLKDILTWQQYIQNATEYDNTIIEELEVNIASLQQMQVQLDECILQIEQKKADAQAQREDLNAKQLNVQESTQELDAKRLTVDTKRAEAYGVLKTLNEESEEYKALDAQMKAEEDRIDAEMNARLAQIASVQEDPTPVTTTSAPTTTTTTAAAQPDPSGEEDENIPSTTAAATTTTTKTETIPASTQSTVTPASYGLICPVQSKSAYVSGTYPYYQNGGEHHGIDIVLSEQGKTLGYPVVAPQDGKVITVGYDMASRGHYFEIDHGNGLVTRYYHCSAVSVSLGQTVKQGQEVAKIGETGNANGPHLHFEVLLNTKNGLIRQNPLSYISVP